MARLVPSTKHSRKDEFHESTRSMRGTSTSRPSEGVKQYRHAPFPITPATHASFLFAHRRVRRNDSVTSGNQVLSGSSRPYASVPLNLIVTTNRRQRPCRTQSWAS